jgi:hypothetical protein
LVQGNVHKQDKEEEARLSNTFPQQDKQDKQEE